MADQFGYSTASVHQMATLLRSGKLSLFAEPKPGPKGPRKATGELRERVLALIERHKVTHLHMVPIMFNRLIKLPEDVKAKYDVSSLKFVVHAAAPAPGVFASMSFPVRVASSSKAVSSHATCRGVAPFCGPKTAAAPFGPHSGLVTSHATVISIPCVSSGSFDAIVRRRIRSDPVSRRPPSW